MKLKNTLTRESEITEAMLEDSRAFKTKIIRKAGKRKSIAVHFQKITNYLKWYGVKL